MSEYAPPAIRALFDAIKTRIPAAQLSGIVGDPSHTYGYHRCRNVLPAGDYSTTAPLDKIGDGWAAAALDVSLPADLMRAVSARLMAACRDNDPRVASLREWFGTLDGRTVTGWDRQAGCLTTSDDSHLWHVHLSVYRARATDAAALAPIADVFAGVPAPAHAPSGGTATPIPATPTPTAAPTPTPKEADEMYTLFEVASGPTKGRQYAVRPGSLPIWLSPADKTAMIRFGQISNPSKPGVILQAEIDQIATATRKGMA